MKCFILIEADFVEVIEELILYCKSLGLKVVFFCKNKSLYDQKIYNKFDKLIELNTMQLSSLKSAVDLLADKYIIKGVLSLNDNYLLQTAALCEYLELPTNNEIDIFSIKNRYKLKNKIKKINPCLNPRFEVARNFIEAELFSSNLRYPFVIKPIFSNKHLCVKKISNLSEMKNYFEEIYEKIAVHSCEALGSGVLLEEIVNGTEYEMHFLRSIDGRLILTGVFIKEVIDYNENEYLNIAAHYPANYDETDFLFQFISPVIHKLGFRVGSMQVNCKIENGNVKILDIIPSMNQNPTAYEMIKIATGVNLFHLEIDLALGKKINWYPESLKSVSFYKLLLTNSGIFKGINNLNEIKNHPNVESVKVWAEIGKWYSVDSLNSEVVAGIMVSHDSVSQASDLARKLSFKANLSK